MGDTIAILKRLFMEEWKTLMVVNLLTAVCSLPLFTIGPAILAMNGVLTRVADDRCGISRVDEFKSVFKAKFWRGLQLEILTALFLLMLIWGVALADVLEGPRQTVLMVCIFASLGLAAMTSVYFIPLLCDSKIPFFQALWNSVFLALGYLPRTLLAVVGGYGILIVFILLLPVSFPLLLAFAVAAAAACSIAVTWPAIDTTVFEEED